MKDQKAESTPQTPVLQNMAETSLYATELERRRNILNFDQLMEKLHAHNTTMEMKNEELLQAQTALKNAQAHYKDLFDSAPIGYLKLNNKGLIVEINLTAAKLHGMERKNIINLPFEQFIVDDYKDHWHRHFLYALENGGVHRYELPIRLQNGTTLFYQLDCMCIGMDNEPSHLIITLTDVTELKLAETQLRIAAVALNTQDGVFITDPDNIILRVNLAFTNITGYSDKESVGSAHHSLRSDLHDKSFHDVIQTTIQQFGHWEGEISYKHKNGKVIPMWLKKTAVKDADGQISHYVESFTDISERKKAEEALRIASVAFEIHEGIMVTDSNKVILRVNEGFTRITGYSDKEVIGKTPAILHSGLHDNAFYDALWGTLAREGYWQGEIWNKRKNGDIFPLLQTISAVLNEEGRPSHYVGAMMDISSQKQTEKTLLDAREHLENQVATSQEEVEKNKKEIKEINTALNVLLKNREKDKDEAQISLSNQVEGLVMPLLKKLKDASKWRHQALHMIGVIEDNVKVLMKYYGRANSLDSDYQKLTMTVRQVASMVKLGKPTKVIASTLNICPGTVSIHRKNIRKKLLLNNETNLQAYLKSLAE